MSTKSSVGIPAEIAQSAHEALCGIGDLCSEATVPCLKAIGFCMIGDGLDQFSEQLKSLARQVEELSRAEVRPPIHLEIVLPDSGLPHFAQLHAIASAFMQVHKGSKDPNLADTYRFGITVDAAAIADPAAFVTAVRSLASSVISEADCMYRQVHEQCAAVERLNKSARPTAAPEDDELDPEASDRQDC